MQMHSFETHQISNQGKNLSFKSAGSGQAIVLFHSLLADQSSWDLITPSLIKTHQVIQLSLPGFDESDFVGGSLDAISDQIAEVIHSLKLTQAPIFMGNGYGGFVALNTALRHPQLPAKLVLADCGTCFSEPGRAAFRGMSENAKNKGLIAIADVAMRRLFAPEYQTQHPQLIADRKERFLNIHMDTFQGACAALSTMDLRPLVTNLAIPSLVVVGEFDEATPVPMSEELAKLLPNAQLKILPGLAHVPQLQDPHAFLEAIHSFI
ncbi:hydrolase [Polynucleobacter sp. SHI2]|uniref:alpha/beta fold hydrolase n=1 Tax=Polynucleobacter sp. SHI2 TaxID=926417 RepID=UPI002491F46A|nr:alpha/beta hydrolase [Polynucleobacter sp. SHI2]BDW11249.1 hydrolase [Polynucleobacter sp. SHI2]